MKRLVIKRLIDRPDCIEALADWLLAEWPEVVDSSHQKAIINIAGRTNFDRLPLALVAFQNGQLAGTATLTLDEPPRTLAGLARFVPVLATLYVPATFRRQGIGNSLCNAIAGEAARLGHPELFLYTETAADFYHARGWQSLTNTPPVFMRRAIL